MSWPRKETLAGIVAAALIVTAVATSIAGYLRREDGGMLVGALTALVVVWYTVETSRLRRDAETRTIRDTQAVAHFGILNPESRDGVPQLLVHGAMPADGEYWLRFVLRNESGNFGIGRIRVRLAVGDHVVMAEGDAYDGTREWEIGPYFNLVGEFDVERLHRLVDAREPLGERRRPEVQRRGDERPQT